MASRVADLSVDELKIIIQETVTQTLKDWLRDPDRGLSLREDFEDELQQSLQIVQMGGETFPAEDVAAQLGLDW